MWDNSFRYEKHEAKAYSMVWNATGVDKITTDTLTVATFDSNPNDKVYTEKAWPAPCNFTTATAVRSPNSITVHPYTVSLVIILCKSVMRTFSELMNGFEVLLWAQKRARTCVVQEMCDSAGNVAGGEASSESADGAPTGSVSKEASAAPAMSGSHLLAALAAMLALLC